MKAAFRCDAAPAMGVGHLMRCVALADALRERGDETLFLLSPASAPRAPLAEQRGHPVLILDLTEAPSAPAEPDDPPMAHWLPWGWRRDLAATSSAFGDAVNWLVVDHYGIDARWHREAKQQRGRYAPRILAIDDMADRPLAADVLLDHNASADAALYAPRLAAPARLLLGPRYALIRKEVEALRKPLAERPIRRILVTFGGAAAGSIYRAVAEALASLPQRPLTLEIIGVAEPTDRVAIEASSGGGLIIRAFGMVDDLPARMAAADLCIGAAGVSALERALIGAPSLTYVTADNQRLAIAALARAGVTIDMGDIGAFSREALVDRVRALTYMPDAARDMAAKGQELVPGGGPQRVAEAMHDILEAP